MIRVPRMLVLCRQTAFSLCFWVSWRRASTLFTCLQELMQQNGIGYVLNASNTCPKPDFIPESHFLRVPVNDSFCEKILPWLDKSVDFIEKAKASNGCVLIHCLAGISRSATIAIAYIMKRMDMSLDEAYRFVKEKRPTISPNFNFMGQLMDYEKTISSQTGMSGPKSKLKLLHLDKASEPVPAASEGGRKNALSLSPPCANSTSEAVGQRLVHPASVPSLQPSLLEDSPLVQALSGLQLSSEKLEDSNRLKRSFSLDIKSVSYSASVAASLHGFSSEDAMEYYKPSATLDGTSKLCQFSPVQEVSEQTPETSPDKEEAHIPRQPQATRPSESQTTRLHSVRTSSTGSTQRPFFSPLHRSGSVEDNYHTNFLFGLSTSQQHLTKSAAGLGLKGWHSDILPPQSSAPSLTSGWYFATEPSHFYSASAIYGGNASYSAYSCSQLPTCSDQIYSVRRRQKPSDRADSRRSWHEESPFEKQFKRRSCQMEFGESIMSENRSREELGKVGSQSSFSGSMEVIEVS
ncbi:dual specificity protein phosphatase 16 isoform X2 [Rattus norvegicus]|uniref:dual specificity protein phosphatase 16 isoform X2 n=1 Tax=Rattus norvegicus TaxID=10116 RepID=UPI0019171D9D|nr:dual specificity protein phosphatase 16 isoform X2 [Rattus norvegicus]